MTYSDAHVSDMAYHPVMIQYFGYPDVTLNNGETQKKAQIEAVIRQLYQIISIHGSMGLSDVVTLVNICRSEQWQDTSLKFLPTLSEADLLDDKGFIPKPVRDIIVSAAKGTNITNIRFENPALVVPSEFDLGAGYT